MVGLNWPIRKIYDQLTSQKTAFETACNKTEDEGETGDLLVGGIGMDRRRR